MSEIDIISQLEPMPEWLDKLESYVQLVLEKEELANWEISLTLCHDPYIKELNSLYRSKDEPTDVLSFCQNEGEFIDRPSSDLVSAGDIVISMDTLKNHVGQFEVSLEEELKRVIIHGILHLKGMDHETNDQEEKMLKHQEILLDDLKSFRIF
ncbi:MAG: rRNA maturation RNase YbeY [Spirochaetaceae bacterium 4572_59]|nr:MAG: rRNA maturation RNase YbeY [Spirochaetaceae bacterium 4572_59]